MFTRKFVFTHPIRNIRFFRTELFRKSGVTVLAKDIFYKSLERNNVSDAFIYSGGSIMPRLIVYTIKILTTMLILMSKIVGTR